MSTRHPRTVYAAGSEPDPRFSLANERTFLAWNRTALALTVGAVAVHAPVLDLPSWATTALSSWLVALAGLAAGQGWLRWRRTELAMRTGTPLPGFAGGMAFGAGVLTLVLVVAVALLVAALE